MSAQPKTRHIARERIDAFTHDRDRSSRYCSVYTVPSKSAPGVTHSQSYDVCTGAVRCSCSGFQHHGHCWHADLLPLAIEIERYRRQYREMLAAEGYHALLREEGELRARLNVDQHAPTALAAVTDVINDYLADVPYLWTGDDSAA